MRSIGFMLMFLVLSFSGIQAQEELSLSKAIEVGLRNNYDIQIVKKNVEVAANNNTQGMAGRYPSLAFNLSQPNTASEQVEVASPFQPRGITISSTISPQLALNWSIFEGFKVNISKQRYEKLQLESEGNSSIVVSNTIQAIVLGYYLAALEKERLDVFERTMALSRDRYSYIKVKYDYGGAVQTDLLLEEGNYLTDSVNFVQQQLTYRSAVRSLNQLMAVEDLNKEYFLTDEIEVPLEEYDLTAMEQKMLENNVDLKTKYLGQSIIKHDLEIAQAERYPKLNLGASAANNWGRFDQSGAEFFQNGEFVPGPTEILTTQSRTYQLSFTLTYNLFNGRQINTAIKNARIREDIGNIEIDKMTLSLRNDLYSDYDNFQIRRQVHGINERKLEAAVTNVTVSNEKFKLGAISSFDFRTVQVNYLTAALAELNSRYGLLETKISLMRLTGNILEVYK